MLFGPRHSAALSPLITAPIHGGKVMQSMPVWNVRVTLFCLRITSALKNTYCSMRWQLFSLPSLFLDTNWAIPVPPRRTVKWRSHLLANSLSLLQRTHFPGSFGSHRDDSHKDLRSFAASPLVHLGPPCGSSTRWYHAWHWPICSGLQPHSQWCSNCSRNLRIDPLCCITTTMAFSLPYSCKTNVSRRKR